jgi:hypothetical protein
MRHGIVWLFGCLTRCYSWAHSKLYLVSTYVSFRLCNSGRFLSELLAGRSVVSFRVHFFSHAALKKEIPQLSSPLAPPHAVPPVVASAAGTSHPSPSILPPPAPPVLYPAGTVQGSFPQLPGSLQSAQPAVSSVSPTTQHSHGLLNSSIAHSPPAALNPFGPPIVTVTLLSAVLTLLQAQGAVSTPSAAEQDLGFEQHPSGALPLKQPLLMGCLLTVVSALRPKRCIFQLPDGWQLGSNGRGSPTHHVTLKGRH